MSAIPAFAPNVAFSATDSLQMIDLFKICTFIPILLTAAQTCLCTSYRSATETCHNRVWWHEAIQTHVPMPMSLEKQTCISEVFGDSSLWKTSLHHHCRGSLNKICALPSALPNFHLGCPGPELDRSFLLPCSA